MRRRGRCRRRGVDAAARFAASRRRAPRERLARRAGDRDARASSARIAARRRRAPPTARAALARRVRRDAAARVPTHTMRLTTRAISALVVDVQAARSSTRSAAGCRAERAARTRRRSWSRCAATAPRCGFETGARARSARAPRIESAPAARRRRATSARGAPRRPEAPRARCEAHVGQSPSAASATPPRSAGLLGAWHAEARRAMSRRSSRTPPDGPVRRARARAPCGVVARALERGAA